MIAPPQKPEIESNYNSVESFDDLSTLYSFNTFDTDNTIMSSLPGADCGNHQTYQAL